MVVDGCSNGGLGDGCCLGALVVVDGCSNGGCGWV